MMIKLLLNRQANTIELVALSSTHLCMRLIRDALLRVVVLRFSAIELQLQIAVLLQQLARVIAIVFALEAHSAEK